MARNLLTVMAIKATSKRKLNDGDGLRLHASTAGGRYWVFQYTRGGRRREMGLGPYGAGTGQVTLAVARAKADAVRQILGQGGDPFKDLPERKAVKKKVTFGSFSDTFIDDAVKAGKWRGAKTEAGWRNTLGNHAKLLRKMSIADIETDDILRVLQPIWHDKHETATKVRERLKIVLDAAKVAGHRVGDNPAAWEGHLALMLTTPDASKRGHHPAMPFKDVPAFMKALRMVEGVGCRALEFAVLTASRSGEARGATWDEIDLDRKLWSIPASRMKPGRPHRVPLSNRAVEILKEMASMRISDYVFPGRKRDAPLSDPILAKVLAEIAGEGFTPHGFRSSFRDWVAEETNFPTELAEAALSHATGSQVERAYRRGDALEKRGKMLEAWSKYCR